MTKNCIHIQYRVIQFVKTFLFSWLNLQNPQMQSPQIQRLTVFAKHEKTKIMHNLLDKIDIKYFDYWDAGNTDFPNLMRL